MKYLQERSKKDQKKIKNIKRRQTQAEAAHILV